jgi:hypothetical protein
MEIESVNPPWRDRPTIYQHIVTHIRPGEPGLGEEGDLLPDEEIVRGENPIRWVPGARDGVLGHHGGAAEAIALANQILESLRALTRKRLTNVRVHSTGRWWNSLLSDIWTSFSGC